MDHLLNKEQFNRTLALMYKTDVMYFSLQKEFGGCLISTLTPGLPLIFRVHSQVSFHIANNIKHSIVFPMMLFSIH